MSLVRKSGLILKVKVSSRIQITTTHTLHVHVLGVGVVNLVIENVKNIVERPEGFTTCLALQAETLKRTIQNRRTKKNLIAWRVQYDYMNLLHSIFLIFGVD